MQYNKFVFPAPKASYDIDNKLLILIPKCPIEELIFRIKEAETLSDSKPFITSIIISRDPLSVLPMQRKNRKNFDLLPRQR